MNPTKPTLHSTTHPTPIGLLTLIASDRGLRAVLWPKLSPQRKKRGRQASWCLPARAYSTCCATPTPATGGVIFSLRKGENCVNDALNSA